MVIESNIIASGSVNGLVEVNQPNYARWCVKYLYNLNKADETHPGLKTDFINGYLGIKRTEKPFPRIPIDLTLEQTINAEAARHLSGITYFTNSLAARQRWTKSHSIRASVISHVLDNINPLDESLDKDSLYNIATAKPVPENVANFLLNIEKNGEDLWKQFITECAEDQNRFYKPIKKIKCLILLVLQRRKKITLGAEVIELRMQRDLFG
ncbi:uncharacterized protein TNCV_596261 [Trichonephila clavipes]|nr:uncharacterized protein TNCV_596261 [Trichonephila clavipes]